ncbi:hypothetical protein HRbin33_01616 [bacterium HR33]|nr:hypothetical protein HRbin33_01616 [bacterium HR33]
MGNRWARRRAHAACSGRRVWSPAAVERSWASGRSLGLRPGAVLAMAVLAVPLFKAGPLGGQQGAPVLDSDVLGGLVPRAIGPATTSGRISAIDAVPTDPLTIYVGAAGGGVWKSEDGGITFKPIFDDYPQSIGAIAVDPSNPRTVWVGTGESWVRNSVSVGFGVYKSTDGGETWRLAGLERSERIARIVVHPKQSDIVYVCATGPAFSSGGERGVYQTTDGGKTFRRVLFVNDDTGCSDLAIDPQEPRILYAGMWQYRRRADFFTSGGPGSGLYKSTDGGETWRLLTNGLPEGEKGRIAVAVAPSRPSVVYALVEAKTTALYRSEDLGEHFEQVNASNVVQARPFYFALVVVDPTDYNRVYKPSFFLGISTDGGRSFSSPITGEQNVHSDHHALWVNPKNPHHLILGTDGGVYMSYDRGAHWRHVRGLPVAQFYEVSYDLEWPYNVYGGLQDNGTWMAPSRSIGGVKLADWRNIGMGDGFHAFPDPTDRDLVYVEYQGGNLLRVRKSTGEVKEIKPYAGAGEPKLRFNWNTPVHLSPTQPGTIYVGAQYLFRSRDRGESWERISPDLTTNDPSKQRQHESGGLTVDNTSAENHTTIYTISESPLDPQVIWVGTDDGNLQVTRDSGRTWRNVAANVPGLPAGTWVSHVEASRFGAGTAYATFDGHYSGDMRTYVYRTTDYGATWESLAGDSLEGYAHVIREDPVNPQLLFLGTELGLFVSLDGGASWVRFRSGFPKVAVRDLAIHPREHDLIIATHGRGIYILDDITPLRALSAGVLARDAVVLPSRPAVMVAPAALQAFSGDDEFVGANPEEAAMVAYYLKRRPLFGELKLLVYDSAGNLVSSVPGTRRRGVNRVAWPMRLRPPKVPRATSLVAQAGAFWGPRVPEGKYRVKLVAGSDSLDAEVLLEPDPRVAYSAEDRAVQDRAALRLYDLVQRLAYVVDAVVELRDSVRARSSADGVSGGLRRRLSGLADRLEGFRSELVSTSEAGRMAGEEKLRERLVSLYGAVNGYEGRPTASQLEQVEVLAAEVEAAERRLAQLAGSELQALNRELRGRGLGVLRLLAREEWERR